MNINELTIGQIKELQAIFGTTPARSAAATPYDKMIGGNVIVRTVTMIFTGKLLAAHPRELVLTNVSWIPETERYMQFVAEGKVKECEPYPEDEEVLIGRGAILDVVALRQPVPRSQK